MLGVNQMLTYIHTYYKFYEFTSLSDLTGRVNPRQHNGTKSNNSMTNQLINKIMNNAIHLYKNMTKSNTNINKSSKRKEITK